MELDQKNLLGREEKKKCGDEENKKRDVKVRRYSRIINRRTRSAGVGVSQL